jgi:hypothetical protein
MCPKLLAQLSIAEMAAQPGSVPDGCTFLGSSCVCELEVTTTAQDCRDC